MIIKTQSKIIEELLRNIEGCTCRASFRAKENDNLAQQEKLTAKREESLFSVCEAQPSPAQLKPIVAPFGSTLITTSQNNLLNKSQNAPLIKLQPLQFTADIEDFGLDPKNVESIRKTLKGEEAVRADRMSNQIDFLLYKDADLPLSPHKEKFLETSRHHIDSSHNWPMTSVNPSVDRGLESRISKNIDECNLGLFEDKDENVLLKSNPATRRESSSFAPLEVQHKIVDSTAVMRDDKIVMSSLPMPLSKRLEDRLPSHCNEVGSINPLNFSSLKRPLIHRAATSKFSRPLNSVVFSAIPSPLKHLNFSEAHDSSEDRNHGTTLAHSSARIPNSRSSKDIYDIKTALQNFESLKASLSLKRKLTSASQQSSSVHLLPDSKYSESSPSRRRGSRRSPAQQSVLPVPMHVASKHPPILLMADKLNIHRKKVHPDDDVLKSKFFNVVKNKISKEMSCKFRDATTQFHSRSPDKKK